MITRFLRSNIRMLKKQYPTRVEFKKLTSTSLDLDTGVPTRTYTSKAVRKAIFLPYKLDRKFVYDLAYIASNKNFTQGGYFGKRESTVIIENRDLNISADINDQVEISGQTWKIVRVNTHHTNVFTVYDLVSLEGNDDE